MRHPTFAAERAVLASGNIPIGVDEVGCGCLAGPVVAAAMYLPVDSRMPLIRDSKALSARQREHIVAEFTRRGYRWGIGTASAAEVDALNVRNATYLAMRRAVASYCEHDSRGVVALIDAWTVPDLPIPQRGIVHGDAFVKSIAAASVVAKVFRDAHLRTLDAQYPMYGFAQHKGYGTAQHYRCIARHGVSAEHRITFLRNLAHGMVRVPEYAGI